LDLFHSLWNIDWAKVTNIFSIFSTLAIIIISIFGLNTWRKQLKGTSEYELSKKAILLTYEVQQLIQDVRNPMLHLPREEVESGNRLEAEQKIYSDRFELLDNKWAQLRTVILESKVIWTNAATESFEDLKRVIGKLRGAIWLHFWMKGAYAGPGTTVDDSPERKQQNDKVVYFISDSDDFSTEINKAVQQVENFFKQKVRGK